MPARKPAATKTRIRSTPTAKPSPRTRRAARNAPVPPPTSTPTIPLDDQFENDPDTPGLIRTPRRKPPTSTPAQRRAAQNLLSALGGPDRVVDTLRLSSDAKASRLADLLGSSEHNHFSSFHLQLQQAGFKGLADFTDLLLDVRNASVLARLLMSGDEVAESILARATDQFQPHTACHASGRMLDDETGLPTDVECFHCQGTGYTLVTAEREWVELYLELVKMRKNQPVNDFSRKVTNQNLNLYGDLPVADGAPSIDEIIKRADKQHTALPSAVRELTDGKERMPDLGSVMPEDAVVEAEVVSEVAVGSEV